MAKFDDFDTQIQIDEIYLRMKTNEYFESESEGKDDFWEKYDVDCDDGTQGEAIYIPCHRNAPIV